MNALLFLYLLSLQVFSETALLRLFRQKRGPDEEEALSFNSIQEIRRASVENPYKVRLNGTLATGHALRIRGMFDHEKDWASINLLDDDEKRILHMSFRFSDDVLVLNSHLDTADFRYGDEERVPLPYEQGDPFSIRLRMTHEGYEIWCNDTMVRMYRHRLPVDRVKHLEVRDGTVYSVEWFSGIFNLPYEAGIPGGALRLDHHCEVEGIPNGERFAVDLYGKDGNILFHFNPRFRGRGGYIVRNSYKSGSWVKEERDGEFPFKIGRSFVVRINNKKQEIEFLVDNKHIGVFKHRTDNPDKDYEKISIWGGIDMIRISCPA